MNDGRWVWVGGERSPTAPGEARIPATEHAYLYGSGLYETLRTYQTRPFALEEHLERLAEGMAALEWGRAPLGEMATALQVLAERRAPQESYLRLAVGPGLQFPGWNEPLEGPVRWCAFAGPLPPQVATARERGVHCTMASRPRWNPGGFIPAAKFAGNPDLWLAKREATAAGAYEALLRNPSGNLAEGSSSNIFLVKAGRLVTPDLASGILDGVTRCVVLGLAPKAGLVAEERPVAPGELFEAQEAFLTSTLKEVVPVVSVDGRPVGGGAPGVAAGRMLGFLREYALERTKDGTSI
jgi:branched-subunit amino acid aminotransferase/4-amino-4-deoxychorismate lyase